MVNPYYYLFYLSFKCLGNPLKRESNDIFVSSSLLVLLFIIHSVFFLIILKTNYNIELLPNINKFGFGVIFTIAVFIINYYLLEFKYKYIKVLKEMKKAERYKKITCAFVLVIYLLMPFYLNILH
jgi:hypothetical protein